MSIRQKLSQQERELAQSGGLVVGPGETLSLSHNTDALFDAVTSGSVQNHMPATNESVAFSLDLTDVLIRQAIDSGALDQNSNQQVVKQAARTELLPMDASKPKISISKQQAEAIHKFPALIEFLGSADGVEIAKQIAEQLLSKVAQRVDKNSKSLCKEAKLCVFQNRNMKQFFEFSNRLCVVTASGPFRGDEAIVFDRSTETAQIVRLAQSDDRSTKQTDVTNMFNVVCEMEDKDNAT